MGMRQVGQGYADRLLLLLRLTHRGAPRQRQISPRIRAVRGPVVLWRLLEGSRLFVPFGAIGSQRLQTLRATLGVEAGEGNRLSAGGDAVHHIPVRRAFRLAAQQDERLDPRTRSRRSSLAHLHVVGIPVSPVIAALVEPFAIVIEALTVALVIVHD